MTLKKWEYILTLRTKNLRIARKLSNICYRCGIKINIGEEIFSRNANSRKSKSKIYHRKCAEAVNII